MEKVKIKREVLSGNEAIARGAYEAQVKFAAGYPGTPSSEILENIAKYENIYAEWSVNEKVALEAAIGASLAGARAIVTMKHVGLNVASDPFMTLSYTGVRGGLVVISADDPQLHSSQNEQDNRNYAKFAKVPLIEPSDSQEAKDYLSLALKVSEDFDTPVLFRITTRIAHSKGVVQFKEPQELGEEIKFIKNPQKYVMIPAHGRKRRIIVEERLKKLADYSNRVSVNRIEWGGEKIGIITHGIAYQYAKEVFPEASFLKLGMSYPLPCKLVEKFVSKVKNVLIVEEGDPFIEEEAKIAGFKIEGKRFIPRTGELNLDLVEEAKKKFFFFDFSEDFKEVNLDSSRVEETINPSSSLPARPPLMCAGCPHRGVFYILNKLKTLVTGDIGCYTLAVLPPLTSMDTTICMGAGIGNAHGMDKVGLKQKVVAVIGDSTFFHSGMTGLLNIIYNKGCSTVVILDNRTTAMTGRQEHPGTGLVLKGEPTAPISLEKLVRGFGIRRVKVVDPYRLDQVKKALKEEIQVKELSVIVSRRSCILLPGAERKEPLRVNPEKCTGCQLCLKLGCPAITSTDSEAVEINPLLCTGCGLCAQVCRFEAIGGENA